MRYKTKKRKKNKYLIIVILVLVIITSLVGYKYFCDKNVNNIIISNKFNYSTEAFEIIKNDNLLNKIDKYSKTLEEVLLNNVFIEKYLKDYQEINYLNKTNFINNINTFLNKGYKTNEINNIYKMNDDNINKLLKIDYININEYYSYSNFNVDNYDRYVSYQEKNKYSKDKIVTYVNINLDYDFYTYDQEISNPQDLLVLVNKYNYLPKGFIPKNLKSLSNKTSAKMVTVAANAYEELIKGALEDNNLSLCATTAYRDYSWQKSLYDSYVSKNGKEKADTYSARPGYSEHQTGLAVDLMNTKNYGTNKRLNDEDYEWLKENAHEYGFIIRYPENKTFITGYINETWHLRYVGANIATDIVNKNLTYEEYYDLYIKK